MDQCRVVGFVKGRVRGLWGGKVRLSGKCLRRLTLIPAAVVLLTVVLYTEACFGPGPSGYSGSQRQQAPQARLAPGIDTGMKVTIGLSKPANGSYLVAGENLVITVTLSDKFGGPLTRDDFATLNLSVYGPQETTKTVTALGLLNQAKDRSQDPRYAVGLVTDTRVRSEGNVLRYALYPVRNEEAGTYTASLYAVKKGDPPVNQIIVLEDFQLGTAQVEKQIVAKEKCASCHLGAANGQFYFHHVDPGKNPYGDPAREQIPVRSCKVCHNNDGYAAYTSPVDGKTRISDAVVTRVHGIHNGEQLKNPLNRDPQKGVFRNYTHVVLPSNVKNCTACHADDRWKTRPSRLACGACHDNIWFGDVAVISKTAIAHKGGPQEDDSACTACHPADSGGVRPISVAHKVSQPLNRVAVSMTPPRNGKFYAAGDKAKITLVVHDDSGKPLSDHTKVDDTAFSVASLFVYGPRYHAVPVLTGAARNGSSKLRASVSNTKRAAGSDAKGWTFTPGDTLKIGINGGAPLEFEAPAGLQTPNQIRDWLRSKLTGVSVTASATNVSLKSNIQGDNSQIAIYNSKVTTIMGWKPQGLLMEPYVSVGRVSYPQNDFRKLSNPLDYGDPLVTRNVENITYPLDDAAGLPPGTYFVYVWVQPVKGRVPNISRPTIGFLSFQVGTEKEDKKIATNCTECHLDTIWHLDEGPQHPAPFNPDYCVACHDYNRSHTGDSFASLGGTSLNGWSGFGATPLARRVHGVHFGRYLAHPEQIYAGNPDAFREVIFPQDVRNCSKCHDPQGSPAWKEEPSRLACMSCHDSDIDNAHARIMTFYPTPGDPWSSDRIESCKTCHGTGREFAIEKVHNITTPYRPPYRREPEEK